MKIIVCLDENNGMLFNKRRQSQDAKVRGRILELVGNRALWMNSYTRKQFNEDSDKIVVDEQFLENAPQDDFCFVENLDLSLYIQKVSTLVVYRWNRKYPSDTKLPDDLLKRPWNLKSTFDFPGNSHELITEEVYNL